MKGKSIIEETFALQCRAMKLEPVRELKFHPVRKWRFDFAFPDRMVAVECEGGVWTQGRHTRGSGVVADMEKYNEAACMGWSVFRFDAGSIKDGSAVQFMAAVLAERRNG